MSAPTLRFSGVNLSYGKNRVLAGVDARIAAQSRTIIAGENGAGKSSLLRIALGVLFPDSGRVEVFGHPIGSAAWRGNRNRAGYVHQGSIDVDMPITAREVVSIGTSGRRLDRSTSRGLISRAMEATGCRSLAERPYRVLSGGEKQKVSVARCLCQEPHLLLLDEPCASLDPESTEELMTILERLSEDIAVVMVTHDVLHLDRTGWDVKKLQSGKLE